MTSMGGGYKIESAEARALKSINADSYDYRDQGKLLSKLTGDVSYLAQYTRQMQQGIDAANENFVQQIGSLISDITTLLGGGGDTGFDFGDLKYVFQAIGALFGFDTENGLASLLPMNLFSAAWHFVSTYILPTENLGEYIDWVIDQFLATLLDIFGEIPVVGEALQQFAVWITQIRDLADALWGLIGSWTVPFVEWLTSSVQWLADTFLGWTEPIATWVNNSVDFLIGLFGGWTGSTVTTVVDAVDWVLDIFNGWTSPFTTWITNSLNGLTTTFADWSIVVADWVRNTLAFLSDLFTDWTEPFVTWLVNTVNFLNDVFGTWTSAVAQWVYDSVAWLSEIFADWTEPLVTWLTTTVDFLSDMFNDWNLAIATWINESVTWLTDLFNSWDGPFVNLIRDVVDAVQEIVDWFAGAANSAFSFLFPWAKTLPQMEVVSGVQVVKATNVPSLDASKIGSGTLADVVIPPLAASKITSGTLADSRIPPLSATKITSGTLSSASMVPVLDASKVTTGNFDQNRVTNLTTDLSAIDTKAVVAQSALNTAINSGANLCPNPGFENPRYVLTPQGGKYVFFRVYA